MTGPLGRNVPNGDKSSGNCRSSQQQRLFALQIAAVVPVAAAGAASAAGAALAGAAETAMGFYTIGWVDETQGLHLGFSFIVSFSVDTHTHTHTHTHTLVHTGAARLLIN